MAVSVAQSAFGRSFKRKAQVQAAHFQKHQRKAVLQRVYKHIKPVLDAQRAASLPGSSTRSKAKALSGDLATLSKTSFGTNAYLVSELEQRGLDGYLEWQLEHELIDDFGLDQALQDALPTLSFTGSELLELARMQEPEFNPALEILVATLVRQLTSPRQLFEVMNEFWSNHFSVFLLDDFVRFVKTIEDRVTIRPNAMTDFATLLHADARSPAMLVYLDNFQNSRFGPNENYARELMELHTLGVDGGYTEEDVKAVALCFTGWTLSLDADDLFDFNPDLHDYAEKTVLGERIKNRQGFRDGEQVLDLLAQHPATASRIAEKLCRRFIADAPDDAVVQAVADTYLESAGDVKAMLRTIFASSAFAAAKHNKFKRPAEYYMSIPRAMFDEVPERALELIAQQLQSAGQLPFFYPAPSGYPDTASSWINHGGLLDRFNYAYTLAYASRDGSALVDLEALLAGLKTPAEIAQKLLEFTYLPQATSEQFDQLVNLIAQDDPTTEPLPRGRRFDRARFGLATLLAGPLAQYR